jgi:hypothetical protein
MIRKIVALSIACVIVLTLAVGGTWAFLSDSGLSPSNQISAKTLSLLTGTSPDGGVNVFYSSGLTQSFNVTALKPGQSTPPVTIYLKNPVGNIYGSSVDFHFKYSKVTGDAALTPVMSADSVAQVLKVTLLDYNRTTDLTTLIPDGGKGYITLYDLMTYTSSPNAFLNGLPGINAGMANTFSIQFQMLTASEQSNINDFQGDGVNVTMLFTINQAHN